MMTASGGATGIEMKTKMKMKKNGWCDVQLEEGLLTDGTVADG